MDELISKKVVLELPRNITRNMRGKVVEESINVELIEALPPVQERKKGQWIDKSNGIEGAWNYCSVYGEQAIDLYDFCPNCGADMRGGSDGTD